MNRTATTIAERERGASTPAAAVASPGGCFDSGDAAVARAYDKALGVMAADLKDGRFLAGQNWAQVWTRDTAYAVDLAGALLYPDVSRTTLLGLAQPVEDLGECWRQDECGHFGGWPNLTDAIAGASGAWALYLVTGDRTLLKPIHERTQRSPQRAERDARLAGSGLFGGGSALMESNRGYPGSYARQGARIGRTAALSTCVLYYNGYRIAAFAGRARGRDVAALEMKAAKLREAINARLWMADAGYYAFYLDEADVLNTHLEGLGEALAILYGVADAAKARSILERTPTTPWGFPCQWPQMDYGKGDADYYHNGMIWPFVQGYWARAAAEQRQVEVFGRELDALVTLSEKADTFMEFYRPEDGAPDGSPRQLWSAAGFLSMIYHGLCGMRFEARGVRFAPVLPPRVAGFSLRGLRYRGITLDIAVHGQGTRLAAFRLDGKPQPQPFLDGTRKGGHPIVMEMAH